MKLNYVIFWFNITIPLIGGYILLTNELYLAMFFLICIYIPSIIINRDDNYSSFFYFFTSIYYMHRIPIIGFSNNEFWYDLNLYSEQFFSESIIYLSIIFSLCGIVIYYVRNTFYLNKQFDIELSKIDVKVIRTLLYLYLLTNFIVTVSSGFTVGYTVPIVFQPFVRLSQFLFPLSFLIFAPFFTKKDMIIFVVLLISTSLLAGSKAVIYNLFIALLVSKLIFNDNRANKIVLIGLFGLFTGPIMFYLVNYIRYPELFEGISFSNYLISSSDTILYAFSEVSHRFGGYFDTLLAFTTNHNNNDYKINGIEYLYEVGGAVNRMVPGDLFDVSNLYLPFEEKSAYELRNVSISHEEGIGRHTESLAFARFYFLGYIGGSILFIGLISIIYKLNFSTNIFFRLFLYYYTIDILSGGDIQSLIVYPLNLLILILIFKISKVSYFNIKSFQNEKYSH